MLLFAGIAGAPLLWLATMQAGYILAYQACDDHSTSWVVVPTLASIAIAAVIVAVSMVGRRHAIGGRLPLPLLGWMAVLMAVTMVMVLAASAIGPIVLQPCD